MKSCRRDFTEDKWIQMSPFPASRYDAAGNTSSDTVTPHLGRRKPAQVTANTTYLYDGDGRRVATSNTVVPLVPTNNWMAGGEILAETNGAGTLQNEYVFFGGKARRARSCPSR